MNDIDKELTLKVAEKWFIDKEKKLWTIVRSVRDIQHLVDMIKEFSRQDIFSKFRTQKEGFTAGAEYGSKQARIKALDEFYFMIDEPQNYPNRNAEKDLDILTKWIDTELGKLRSK